MGASLILSDCSNLLILHYKKELMRILGGCILNLFFAVIAFAEPYLSPNNPFIRHEIRLLADEGELTGLQNTWPLDLGGLSSMRNDAGTKLPHSLLDDKIFTESRSGWSPIFTTIGLADDRVTARGFGPNPVPVLRPTHRSPG